MNKQTTIGPLNELEYKAIMRDLYKAIIELKIRVSLIKSKEDQNKNNKLC